MSSLESAEDLAQSIVRVADLAGTKTKAVITDMNQVLGYNVGNAVEVAEAVDFLKGENVNPRLSKVTLELCQELLLTAKLATNPDEAMAKLQTALSSGAALEKFAAMVAALGGPVDFCDNPWQYLPQAPIVRPAYPSVAGYVASIDTRGVGLSIIELKGGRATPEQKLNYANGYSRFCQIGDMVDREHPLCFVHAGSEDEYRRAAHTLQNLVSVSDKQPAPSNCIIKKIC